MVNFSSRWPAMVYVSFFTVLYPQNQAQNLCQKFRIRSVRFGVLEMSCVLMCIVGRYHERSLQARQSPGRRGLRVSVRYRTRFSEGQRHCGEGGRRRTRSVSLLINVTVWLRVCILSHKSLTRDLFEAERWKCFRATYFLLRGRSWCAYNIFWWSNRILFVPVV